MKRQFLLYSLSVGINRGAILIYTPILLTELSIVDFGIFSYILVLLQLLAPLIGLNIYTGLAREGAENANHAININNDFSLLIILNVIIVGLIQAFFLKFDGFIFTYAVLLGGVEALCLMQLNLIRIKNQPSRYFFYTFLKTIGFTLILYGVIFFKDLDLHLILTILLLWNLIVFIIFSLILKVKFTINRRLLTEYREVILFSVALIPHGLSQWLLSSSSRLIIKEVIGDQALGVYSIAFNLASILMLINSGIALILPQNFVRNPDFWLNQENKKKFLFKYTFVFVLVYLFLIVCVYANKNVYSFIILDDYSFLDLLGLISSSFYLLGYYYYYSNVLFFTKDAGLVSKATIFSSLFSVFLTYFFSVTYGLLGVAVASVISYFVYYFAIYLGAKSRRKEIKFLWLSDILLPVAVVLLLSFSVKLIF